MPDNRNTKGPQDSARINVNEDYELSYWTEKFGVNPDQLKKAVQEVGVSAQAVEEYLRTHRTGH